jgi:8-oxo-dGTP pyrophosphatase MutT (NUDIX family)
VGVTREPGHSGGLGGGGAKEPEDPDLKSTAVRELFDETGYKIKPTELMHLTTDEYTTEKGVPVKRTIFYGYYDYNQEIKTYEGQEIRFVAPSELHRLNIYTGHESFLRAASQKAFGRKIEVK